MSYIRRKIFLYSPLTKGPFELRCEICDFSADTPSTYWEGLASEQSVRKNKVQFHSSQMICDTCWDGIESARMWEHAEGEVECIPEIE